VGEPEMPQRRIAVLMLRLQPQLLHPEIMP
jgi:hypothetical protein